MLSRLFSGPDTAAGAATRSPRSATPTRRSTAGGAPRCPTSSNFARRRSRRRDGRVPTLPLTVNRRSDARILDVANRLAAPLYEKFPQVDPLDAKPDAEPGEVAARVFETHADELAWLVERCRRGARSDRPAWSKIGVLTRDNAHAEEVFDALTSAGVPVEIVGLSGLLRLPEVAEIVATLHLLHDVTANAALLTLLTGPRWAIGPRDLRLLGQPRREVAGRQGRGPTPTSITDHLLEIADGIDPAEIPSLDDALDDPGRRRRTRRRRGSASPCCRRSCACSARTSASRSSTSSAGSSTPPASTSSSRRRSARPRRPAATTSTCSSRRWPSSRPSTATSRCPRCWPTSRPRTTRATASTSPPRPRPTRSSCSPSTAPRASSGTSVFLVGVCETQFPSNRSRTLWTSSPSMLPAPLRGDADDLPQLRGFDKAALDAYRADTPQAHDAEEELRLGYVAFTRAAHRLSVSSYLWTPAEHALRAVVAPSRSSRDALRRLGRAGRPTGWTSRTRADPNPYAAVDPSRPWPRPAPDARRALGSTPPRRVRAVDPAAPDDRPRHDRVGAGRRVGRRARPAARRGPPRPPHRHRRPAAVQPVRDRAVPGCATTPRRSPATWPGRCRGRRRPPPGSAPASTPGSRRGSASRTSSTTTTSPAGPTPTSTTTPTSSELIESFEVGPVRRPGRRTPSSRRSRSCSAARWCAAGSTRSTPSGQVDGQDGYLVVDWKTNRAPHRRPAPARDLPPGLGRAHRDVPAERVRAAFYYVRTGQVVEPPDLPDRQALEAIVAG